MLKPFIVNLVLQLLLLGFHMKSSDFIKPDTALYLERQFSAV